MAYHSQALSLNGLAAEINLLDPDLPVSVAVTDLDGFAPLNAAHGTEAGDAVLGSFERSLAARLPHGALIAHSRGDEFAVALPDTSCEEALLALEAVRAGFAASDLGQKILSRVPVHRLGTPDEISWAILFLLSPLASYINGVLLVADGGWTITQ